MPTSQDMFFFAHDDNNNDNDNDNDNDMTDYCTPCACAWGNSQRTPS